MNQDSETVSLKQHEHIGRYDNGYGLPRNGGDGNNGVNYQYRNGSNGFAEEIS